MWEIVEDKADKARIAKTEIEKKKELKKLTVKEEMKIKRIIEEK